jgi:hypothetical protein
LKEYADAIIHPAIGRFGRKPKKILSLRLAFPTVTASIANHATSTLLTGRSEEGFVESFWGDWATYGIEQLETNGASLDIYSRLVGHATLYLFVR